MTAGGYEAVIGLEVHAELLTASKIFCGCSATFGGPPNQHTCPVCLAISGITEHFGDHDTWWVPAEQPSHPAAPSIGEAE